MLLCTGLGLRSGYFAGSPNTCRWQSQLMGGNGCLGARAGRAAPAYFSAMASLLIGHDYNPNSTRCRDAAAPGGRASVPILKLAKGLKAASPHANVASKGH